MSNFGYSMTEIELQRTQAPFENSILFIIVPGV